MVKETPLDVQEAQLKLAEEKAEVLKHQKNIKQLSSFITQRFEEEADKRIAMIAKIDEQKYSNTTLKIIAYLKKDNLSFERFRSRLISPVDDGLFNSKITSILIENHCHFLWQVAMHSEEYWQKVASPSAAREIVWAIEDRGIPMGLNYLQLMFFEESDIEDVE